MGAATANNATANEHCVASQTAVRDQMLLKHLNDVLQVRTTPSARLRLPA